MTNAALYARVSTVAQGQDDRNSLPVQRELFDAYCREHGYDVTTAFVDVMSGARADRPQYVALLEAARRKRFDVVVVTYLDRLGRDDFELMAAIGDLRRHGVRVEAIREDASRFLDVALSAWKAQQERQRISERVTLGMNAAARRGIALGRAPYGYTKAWDTSPTGRPMNHRLVIDEERARWVRDAFTWYAEGNASLREIARRFSESSPLKPNGSRGWFPEEIRKLLTRRRYLGEQSYSDVTVYNAHPAIIEPELFEAVQRRLAVKALMPRGRTQRSDYLLSGLLRCGHCGGPMHGSITRARPEKSRHVSTRLYICSRHYKQRTCAHANGHEASAVEAAVIDALAVIAGDIQPIESQVHEVAQEARQRLAVVESELSRIDGRLVRNLELFERGTIASEAQLAAANRALADEQARLIAERESLTVSLERVQERNAEAAALPAQVTTLIGAFDALEVGERKSLLQSLIEHVELVEGVHSPTVYLRLLSTP